MNTGLTQLLGTRLHSGVLLAAATSSWLPPFDVSQEVGAETVLREQGFTG